MRVPNIPKFGDSNNAFTNIPPNSFPQKSFHVVGNVNRYTHGRSVPLFGDSQKIRTLNKLGLEHNADSLL